MADCFIPVGDKNFDEATIPSDDKITPVFIYKPDEIAEKAGGVL